MKKSTIISFLSVACLLAACQTKPRDAAQGGDALYGPPESATSQSSLDEATRQRYQALNKVHEFYEKLSAVQVKTSLNQEGGDWQSVADSQQFYEAGALEAYRSKTVTTFKDAHYDLEFYFDGDHHYVASPHAAWSQNDNAKNSMSYLYWAKLLIEGEDSSVLDDEAPQGQWRINKTVTNPDLIQGLVGLLDLPESFSAQATYQADLTYLVDSETGQMLEAALKLTVTDGESSHVYQAKSTSQVLEESTTKDSLKPDLEAQASPLEVAEGQWLEAFKAANPTQAISTYEVTEGRQAGDQDSNLLYLTNSQNGQVLAQAIGIIQDKQIKGYQYQLGQKRYSKAEDGSLKEETMEPIDFYYLAVQSLIDHSDQVQTFNPTDEAGQPINDPASATTTTYRLTFENDYDGLAKLAGAIDISNLKREGEAVYGVDYVVNKASLELEGFYLWSLTAEDTAITHVNRYSFRHLNQQAPSLIQFLVDPELVKTAKP